MSKKYMTAKELIKKNTLKRVAVWDKNGVVFSSIAETAVNMAHMEMKEKAIEAFKENCQHPKDAKGCECTICIRWVGGHCELLDGFIEKLNE